MRDSPPNRPEAAEFERALALLSDLEQDFARLSTAEEVIAAAGERIATHLNLSHCLFVEIDEAASEATVFHDRRAPDLADLTGVYRLADFHTEEERRLLASGAPVRIDDVRDGARPEAAVAGFESLSIRALATAPYVSDGRWKFALSAQHRLPYKWREDEIELLRELAPRIYLRLERARAEESLRLSAGQLRVIYDGTQEYIGLLSTDGILLEANRASLAFAGSTREEVVGRPFWETIWFANTPGVPELVREGVRRAAGGEFFRQEISVARPDGEMRTFDFSLHPVRDSRGEVAVIVPEGRDITERKRAEEERERLLTRETELRAAAEEASRLKDEFLATLSHELRTPLTAIVGWSTMLCGNGFDAETTAKGLETIERNARAQQKLIEDLMDVSRIITGKLRLEVRAVELAPVVEQAVESARPAAEAKGIELSAALDPRAGPVSGDPNRLQQVVWNLLSNAIKFTPEGGQVRVGLGHAGRHAELTVSDTGQGIAPEFLPHIFDRFRQADGSYTRAHGGLGLGLAIVRHLIELHGGAVSADSEGEGRGASFRVTLPLMNGGREAKSGRREPAATAAGGGTEECPVRLDGLRVLVVDDEADARQVIALMLEECGAEVLTAGSAAEALVSVERDRPDAIVSDIGMPREDGITLIRRVRELPAARGGRTPAAALTAYAGPEDRRRILLGGFQLHVPKPVEPGELAAAVASLTGRIKRT